MVARVPFGRIVILENDVSESRWNILRAGVILNLEAQQKFHVFHIHVSEKMIPLVAMVNPITLELAQSTTW